MQYWFDYGKNAGSYYNSTIVITQSDIQRQCLFFCFLRYKKTYFILFVLVLVCAKDVDTQELTDRASTNIWDKFKLKATL